MGCCVSSPHGRRKYRDPADLDEEFVSEEDLELRTFGKYRGNQVIVPDDIDGLPSTRILDKLATNQDTLLYEAEIDNGRAWRCVRPIMALVPLWPALSVQCLFVGGCSCDEAVCWVRKEYSTRNYYRVYPNRIEVNNPGVRIPWGYLGCGSWNGDKTVVHPFDRGAFGFHRVKAGVCNMVCCVFPCYGDVVARQRCQCNGPVWHGGWWCDEWPCDMAFCTYRYSGMADGDEVAFASNLALQAYFEGRKMSKEDMEKCLEYWRQNVSEMADPIHRKRKVCCEPFCLPCYPTWYLYSIICQWKRKNPFRGERATPEMQQVYDQYERLRQKQIHRYVHFKYPQRLKTFCQAFGCRRVFGRKGLCFCTEGCNDNKEAGCCYTKLGTKGAPFPPAPHTDWDDDFHAAKLLQTVLGNPPRNVVYKRWERSQTTGQYTVVVQRSKGPKTPTAVTVVDASIEPLQNGSARAKSAATAPPSIPNRPSPFEEIEMTPTQEISPAKSAPPSISNSGELPPGKSVEAIPPETSSLARSASSNGIPPSESIEVTIPVASTPLYNGNF